MNLYMSRAKFESLPFREDLVNDPVQGALFRSKHWPRNVFKAQPWGWDCFRVDFQ